MLSQLKKSGATALVGKAVADFNIGRITESMCSVQFEFCGD